ncbi:MAG: glycosyltransferase family 4 protein [bacterium]|nr:glycosyltransferase family 4 protein [bacterium]MDZ4346711.1 glycosyltransferase family 4 protein [Candidatus Binatia bacterium]
MKPTIHHTHTPPENQIQRHILVFSPLYPPHVGGLETHAQQFDQEMTRRGYKITVFTPLITPNAKLTEKSEGVHIFRFPAWEIIPNYPVPKFWQPLFWEQWHLVKKSLLTTNYSLQTIVLSRTRFFFASIMAGFYAKTHRMPWLHIEHGSDYVHLHNPLLSFIAKFYDLTLGRLILRSADAVVANSHASAAFVKKFVLQKPVTVIYRGVDIQQIQKIQPVNLHTTYYLLPATPIITYAGRLIDGKGVTDLLNALDHLQLINFHCFIIGQGSQLSALRRQAANLDLADRITFLDSQPWEQTISIIKASDIFINPSYTEGLPTSVIEAALCQKAIIATDVGGTKEIITSSESGILIPTHSPQIMSEKINFLVTHPELRKQMGIKAYQENIEKFNWDKSIQKYQEILNSLTV